MPQPVPYISFDGNCREAMHFYAECLGGKITALVTPAETPIAGDFPPDQLDLIMNAQLELPDGTQIMGNDHMMGQYAPPSGITICMSFDTAEEAEAKFNALSEGGTVLMPFSDTFWAKKFGFCRDKFGTPWIINGELIPMAMADNG